MAERVGTGPRVKFEAERLGDLLPGLEAAARALAEAVHAMDGARLCPILDDGRAAGNGALVLADGTLLVSPSGQYPGALEPTDMVQLVTFDPSAWRATYRSRSPSVRPSSDSPLYWAALVDAPARLGWQARPGAALHGHALETPEAAGALGIPISHDETVFSTPADREALLALLAEHPYPAHTTVVRRGHGFFTMGHDVGEARRRVMDLARRAAEPMG